MRFNRTIESRQGRTLIGRGRVPAAGLALALVGYLAIAAGGPSAVADPAAGPAVPASSSAPVSSASAAPAGSTPAGSTPAGSTPAGSTPAGSTSASATSVAPKPSSAAATSPAPAGPRAHRAAPNTLAPSAQSVDLAAATRYLTAPATLIDGHYYEGFAGSGFADFGLTIDGALALAAAGNDPSALVRLVDFINQRGKDGSGQSVDDWTGIGTPYVTGGSLAKEALLAEVTGYDPTGFGGHDLIAALAGTICTAASTGSDTSCAAAGGYRNTSSVFGQALGVLAQLRAGDTARVGAPLSYLKSLQRPDGGWASLIPPGSSSDTDSTAIAVLALALAPNSSTTMAAGLSWLAGQQLPDGGFPGTAGDSVNSAALAALALGLDRASYGSAADRATSFLAGQQNSDGGFNVAAGTPGSDVRASVQAVNAVVGTPFGTLHRDVPALIGAANGARYLTQQLVDGNHLTSPFGPDYGLTADLALALAAAGGQDGTLAKVVGYLRAHVADYADPAGTGQFPGPYSGAVGKLALLAEVTDQDPHSFGGFDLLGTLTGHVCSAADQAGACTAAGDFYQSFSPVSQSLAVLALTRAGVSPPAAAVSRLESLQCPGGGFSSTLITGSDPCTPDPDTTSYALQALSLVPAAGSAVTAATSYLAGTQQTDGGYLGAAGENSNSTGLAIQGLLGSGSSSVAGAVATGQAFLLRLQNPDGGFGIRSSSPASDVRSSTQAVPALVGAILATLSEPVLPVAPVGSSTPPSSTPPATRTPSASSSASASTSASADAIRSGGVLASTGASTGRPLWWALVLLLAGAALLTLTRLTRRR
jgi:prenyltransferase beta subunit